MKANFEVCLPLTLRHEGGYANHPRDPGGPTNMGITIATLSHELGRAATPDEVRALTRETAAAIYRKKYWNVVGCDDLPPGVDALAFDVAVNSGPGRALRWLLETAGLAPAARVRALDMKRRAFWRALPIFPTFGKGWMARERDVLNHALVMTGQPTREAPKPATPRATTTDRQAPERMNRMKGYRTYIAAGLVAAGGLVAQTDWLAFMENPGAGLVALGSGALMAFMRSITTTAPGAMR